MKFSLGFGPKIVAKQYGETTYQLSVIPLGGYVQMLGEGNGDQGEGSEPEAAEAQRSFANKPLSRRLAIVAAGPITNLVFPLIVLPISFMIGVQMPTYLEKPAMVGYVVPESPAAVHGFLAGDLILQVNQEPVASWNETNKSFVNEAGSALIFSIARG